MNDVMKEFQPKPIDHLEEHRRQGISPTGGREIDGPSALETLEESTDLGRLEAQVANPVVGRYLASDGAVTPERLKKIVQGHLDKGTDSSQNLKLEFEGREELVSLGEIQEHFKELESEVDVGGLSEKERRDLVVGRLLDEGEVVINSFLKKARRVNARSSGEKFDLSELGLDKLSGELSAEELIGFCLEAERLWENPEERRALLEKRQKEVEKFGPKYAEMVLESIRRRVILGLTPDREVDVPVGVRHKDAEKDLKLLVGRNGLTPEKLEAMKEEELIRFQEEMKKMMGERMGGMAEMGGDYYYEMYQDAWDNFAEAWNNLVEEEGSEKADEVVANFLVGGSILGGKFAQFYLEGVKQRGRLPSKYTGMLDLIGLVGKLAQLEGYVKPEQVFGAIGFVSPEVLSAIDQMNQTCEVWLEGESGPRRFTISTREMMGALWTTESMARMAVSFPYGTADSHHEVKNSLFTIHVLQKMGYSLEEAREMAGKKGKDLPKVKWANWQSLIRRRQVDFYGGGDMWDWMVETMVHHAVIAQEMMKYSRWDVEMMPIDVARRMLLAERGGELGHYRMRFGSGLPPEQGGINMVELFGSVPSMTRAWEVMLKELFDKKSPNQELSETEKKKTEAERKKRNKVMMETIKIERPIMSAGREMAMMAQGLGEYAEGDYGARLDEGMKKVGKLGIDALRLPELWKHRWFDCLKSEGPEIERDVNKWKYLGREHLESDMKKMWEGVDFTDRLIACGLRPDKVSGLQTKGYEGWKQFLLYANAGLLEWGEASYTLGDKAWRYVEKQSNLQKAALELLGLSMHTEATRPPVRINEVPKVSSQKDWMISQSSSFQEYGRELLGKIVTSMTKMATLVSNNAQQRFFESVLDIYVQGHVACKLDTLIEDISLGKIAGGDNWSTDYLTRKDIESDRVAELMSRGFYFVMNHQTGEEILVTPLAGPVAKLVKAGDFLERLGGHLDGQIKAGKDTARNHALKERVRLMLREKAFCWETLVKGKTDIPPYVLMQMIYGLKEEGNMSASTKDKILERINIFVKELAPRAVVGEKDADYLPLLMENKYKG